MHSDRQWVVGQADTLCPDDSVNISKIDRDRRVKEELGVELHDVTTIDDGHAVDLECYLERTEEAQIEPADRAECRPNSQCRADSRVAV